MAAGSPGRSRRSRPSAAGRPRRTSAGARPSAAAAGFRSPPFGAVRTGAWQYRSQLDPAFAVAGVDGGCVEHLASGVLLPQIEEQPSRAAAGRKPRPALGQRPFVAHSMQKPMSSDRRRRRGLPSRCAALRKVYGDVAAVDGISFSLHARHHHGAARRQRRRQDHDHLHADGARGADLGRGARVRRRHGARAPQGAAPHELREPLRRRADAADRAAEPRGVRQALWRARPQGAHRRDRRGVAG